MEVYKQRLYNSKADYQNIKVHIKEILIEIQLSNLIFKCAGANVCSRVHI